MAAVHHLAAVRLMIAVTHALLIIAEVVFVEMLRVYAYGRHGITDGATHAVTMSTKTENGATNIIEYT